MLIEETYPPDWRELQEGVARILRECGLDSHVEREIALARGTVVVDVFVEDSETTPPATYLCECKHWKAAVSKDVVHGFRTVVTDSGANRGFLISSAGFQSGARDAAVHSNIDLLSWSEFQSMFAERWFRKYMAPTLVRDGDALHEYTEPINSRIARQADRLSPEKLVRFRELRQKYAQASFGLLLLSFSPLEPPKLPDLPLRAALGDKAVDLELPAAVLDASALRPLMHAVQAFYLVATAEFDEVFGGRA